jgi:hypothetical protein
MATQSADVDTDETRVKSVPRAGHVICLANFKKQRRKLVMEDLHNHIDETMTVEEKSTELAPTISTVRVWHQQEGRLRRVVDYLTDVLKKKNHQEAVLGSINAGLMSTAIELDEFIEQALATKPKTFERVQKLLPALQTYLQTTRQIDRLTQIERRMEAARKSKSAGKDDKPTKPR